MNKLKSFFAVLAIISILLSFTLVVSASPSTDPDAPSGTRYEDLWVSAGGSVYTTTIKTTSRRYTCYMRLQWFQFQYHPANNMPSGYHIYTRLYEGSTKASDLATFSGTTARGNYNYYYWDGFGYANEYYRLKTNSDFSTTGYEAYIDWNANPYL